MVRIIHCWALCLSFLPAMVSAQTTVVGGDRKTELSFFLSESEYAPGKYVLPTDSIAGRSLYAKGKLPLSRDVNDRMLTFTTAFRTSDSLLHEPLYLILPPFEYPANIYLNGSIILMRGEITNGYTNRLHDTKAVFLPPGFLRSDGRANVLAVQLYTKFGETRKPFGALWIAGREVALHEEFFRNLFGPTFCFALTIFSFFVFIYFARLHFSRAESGNRYYLYFGLLNLAAAYSHINNAFTSDIQNVLLLERISKIGMNFTALFSGLFILEYSEFLKGTNAKRRTVLWASVLFGFGAALMAVQQTYSGLLQVYFPQIIVLHYPVHAFVIYILIRSVRMKTNKFAVWLLAIYVVNIGFITHDSFYYIAYESKPFLLFVPYGIFLVNLVVFFILAWEQRMLQLRSMTSEKEVRLLNVNLEALVVERTAQLNSSIEELLQENRARRIVQEELDRANKMKDQISFIIGHDLRNIFNTMINYSEILIEDIRGSDLMNIDRDSKRLHHAANSAYHFLESLLEWSAVETKHIAYNPVKISACEIVDKSVELVNLQYGDKLVEIESAIPTDLFVVGDKKMLQSIIRNLVSNAVKYSYSGCMVNVLAVGEGDRVHFTVTDKGMGIPVVEDLHKHGVQQSRRGTSKERGIGIGLLLIKDLLARHNSELKISSTLGGGSTFSFSIQRGDGGRTP